MTEAMLPRPEKTDAEMIAELRGSVAALTRVLGRLHLCQHPSSYDPKCTHCRERNAVFMTDAAKTGEAWGAVVTAARNWKETGRTDLLLDAVVKLEALDA